MITISKSMNSTETSVEKGQFGGCPKVKQVGNIYPDTEKFKNRTMGRIYDAGGISPTINCCGGGDREPKIIDDTYANRDVREYEEFAPTLRSERSGLKVSEHYRIRKLTPRECFRLMGVVK